MTNSNQAATSNNECSAVEKIDLEIDRHKKSWKSCSVNVEKLLLHKKKLNEKQEHRDLS